MDTQDAGRTAIQNLSSAQAKVYGRAIRENHKLERIFAEVRETSLKILEISTEGVPRRLGREKKGNP